MDYIGPIKLHPHQQLTLQKILTSPFPCWEGYFLKEQLTYTYHLASVLEAQPPIPTH